MDQEKETKTEPKTKKKKSSKGRVWMWIWLVSAVFFVLSLFDVFGSFNGIPLLLSIPIGGISLIIWAVKSKAGRIVLSLTILLPICYFLFYLFIARPHKLSDDTMSPTINKGCYVWSEKVSYYIHQPKRGDVVIIYNQNNLNGNITRIVGLPNENISFKPGEIKINGSILNESHINWGDIYSVSKTWPSSEILLKENEYFGLSDNQVFSVTEGANLTSDLNIIKDSLQKFLEGSIFKKNDIAGRITSVKYSCN